MRVETGFSPGLCRTGGHTGGSGHPLPSAAPPGKGSRAGEWEQRGWDRVLERLKGRWGAVPSSRSEQLTSGSQKSH